MEAIVAVLLLLVPAVALSVPVGGPDGVRSDHMAQPPGVPYPGGFFGQDETAVVSVENFRFCIRRCRPDSVAYARTPAGPVPGTDNPRAVVYMPPGAQFTWTYRDTGCDLLRCTGHDIRIEDGTAAGHQIGQVTAETGHESLSWTIPADAEPESIIRYFCARHATFGMTGAFQVLPIGVLTVSPPVT
jgi:plastocyanin